MPDKKTIQRVRKDVQEGKSPSTQAGEFVREEMDHIREGKHGARSAKQAIAIGLSKARRAGVKLAPPEKGTTSEQTRQQAIRDIATGKASTKAKPSPTRSRVSMAALKREPTAAASHLALSRHAKAAAPTRAAKSRKLAAKNVVETKAIPGPKRAVRRKTERTRAVR